MSGEFAATVEPLLCDTSIKGTLLLGSISAAISSPVLFLPFAGDERGLIFPNSGW